MDTQVNKKNFVGCLEAGDTFSVYIILGNFKRKKDALLVKNKNPQNKIEGYLFGKFKRGWLVYKKDSKFA